MSDYLFHLAARSLDSTQSVQPRLASRFESASRAAGAAVDWPMNIASEVTDVGAPQDVPVESRARPVAPQETWPSAHAPVRPSDALDSRRPAETASNTPGQPARLARRKLPDQLASPRERPAAQTDAMDGPAARPPGLGRRPHAWEGTGPRPIQPATREAAPHNVPDPIEIPRAARLWDTPAPATSNLASNVAPFSAAILARPQVKPVARAPKELVETPAPQVHVTIGRIEVRAAPPPPQPARPARASSPVMSLDEYLKQRRGAGR